MLGNRSGQRVLVPQWNLVHDRVLNLVGTILADCLALEDLRRERVIFVGQSRSCKRPSFLLTFINDLNHDLIDLVSNLVSHGIFMEFIKEKVCAQLY